MSHTDFLRQLADLLVCDQDEQAILNEIYRLRKASHQKTKGLYRRIEINANGETDEPVQFVGCYTMRWGKVDQPTVAFVEAD